MNSFIVKLTDIVKLIKNFVIKVIMETNILFFIKFILLTNYLSEHWKNQLCGILFSTKTISL